MKNIQLSLILLLAILLQSCDVVEGIFKVGLWTGIIIVAIIVMIVVFIMRKFKK